MDEEKDKMNHLSSNMYNLNLNLVLSLDFLMFSA